MESRAFRDHNDVDLLVAFARDATAARSPRSTYWHVGDIPWRIYQNTVFDPRANIRLWFDAGVLVGVGWFDAPAHVEFDVRPDADPEIAMEILAWARSLIPASADARLSTTALDSGSQRLVLLGDAGFVRGDQCSVRMRRSLAPPLPGSVLPSGMRLRHATDDDIEERADLHRDAWSVWGPSQVTVEAYRRLRVARGYRADLDIVLETPDGRLASYCICWLDEANGVGEFEPVGTRPEFAGRGLARAVIFEGLRRMRELGMETALVQTASINTRALGLYPSCGFEIFEREYAYSEAATPSGVTP